MKQCFGIGSNMAYLPKLFHILWARIAGLKEEAFPQWKRGWCFSEFLTIRTRKTVEFALEVWWNLVQHKTDARKRLKNASFCGAPQLLWCYSLKLSFWKHFRTSKNWRRSSCDCNPNVCSLSAMLSAFVRRYIDIDCMVSIKTADVGACTLAHVKYTKSEFQSQKSKDLHAVTYSICLAVLHVLVCGKETIPCCHTRLATKA